MGWHNTKDELLPLGRRVICITRHHWTCIGQVDEKFVHLGETEMRTGIKTAVGVDVYGVEWWHELPKLPWKTGDEWFADDEWFRCSDVPPLCYSRNSIEFILFDEHYGITEAEYWGGYQTDVVSCKYGFNKPLFWRPFPRLPVDEIGVLQI